VALALTEYLFIPPRSVAVFPWLTDGNWEYRAFLGVYLWWAAGVLALWVAVPAVALRVAAGITPRALGVRVRGTLGQAPKYTALYALMLPLIYLASRQPEFRANYPFFRGVGGAGDREFWIFELAYFLQFFAVEFFFRGVLVLGLKPALGRLSILVMLTPYCMIHFHKPLAEALGSIVAGDVHWRGRRKRWFGAGFCTTRWPSRWIWRPWRAAAERFPGFPGKSAAILVFGKDSPANAAFPLENPRLALLINAEQGISRSQP
jgi:hypothetical protein